MKSIFVCPLSLILWKRAIVPTLLVLALLATHGFALLGSSTVYAQGTNPSGTIAYIQNGDEIRTINADGSNDQQLWALDDPDAHDINGVDWSPNGNTLAFTSNHERTCSIWDSDVFAIGADGSGLRRVTNAPACADLSAFPQGTVTLEIESQVSDQNLFIVYVEGAQEAATVTLGFGEVKEVTFPNVADFGDGVFQGTSAAVGFSRWVDPSAVVDVVAGGTANAATRLTLRPLGHYPWTSRHPSWKHDGSTIGFTLSDGIMNEIAVNPAVGSRGNIIELSDGSSLGSGMVRSPIGNQIVYSENIGSDLYYADLDAGTPSELLVEIGDTHLVYGMDWLPDGSGFVFAVGEGEFGDETVNLYEYTFATDSLTKLTNFDTELAAHPSVSPDGQHIAFAYQDSFADENSDIRILSRSDLSIQPLNVLGIWPDWRPNITGNPTPEPTATPTAQPTATATTQPTTAPTSQPTTQPTSQPTAQPTSQPTTPPTAAPSPVPATNLIENGGFESGDLNGWDVPDDSTATTTDGLAYGGDYAAYFGGIDDADEFFYQRIDLPNSSDEANLSFWVNQFSKEVVEGSDLFCAAIFDWDTDEELFDLGCLDGVESVSDEYDDGAWWQAEYHFTGADWETLKGRSVWLAFQMLTDDSLTSTVFIDNVVFEVGSASATPTPAPTSEPTTDPSAGRDWTAILYIDGDNNLCDSYPRLIERMENELGAKIGPGGFLNIVALIDHDPRYCQGKSNAIRYVIQPNANYTDGVNRWDMGEVNMGDPQTLENFATWAMQNYPADHYYLAIDDHGGGVTGIAWDDSNGHDQLTNAELHNVMKNITNDGQQKIDVFAYEACLMGMVENAYDISNFTDYIFFFPTISWTNNASYPSYFGDSRFIANTDGATLGDIMFDVYYEAVTRPYVVSLVESGQMAGVQSALNAWATAIQSELGSNKAAITSARSAAQKIDSNSDDKTNDDDAYVDLWDVADKMAAQGIAVAESNALKAAIETAVRKVNYRPADSVVPIDYADAHGLTIFWPQSSRTPYPYGEYISGSLYNTASSSSWDEFLAAYHGPDGRRGMAATLGPIDRRVAPDVELPQIETSTDVFLPFTAQ